MNIIDPVSFADVLRDPETCAPFELYEAEKVFLREAFTLTPEGRLPYEEILFGAPKKSGKTTIAAIACIYVTRVLAGRFGEAYCLANDLEQSTGRVYEKAARIIEASPMLRQDAKVLTTEATFRETGGKITAIASDYAGAAGSNANISIFDELWGYTSERSRRLWDEMVPPPTRKVACRLTVTYAGFEGESELLEELYKRGLRGKQIAPCLYCQPGLLMFWSHDPVAPWQTPAWVEQMRRQLRPNAFLRMIENRWVTTESEFLPIEWWDRIAIETPILADKGLRVVLGVDAGLKRDTAAVAAVAFDPGTKKLRLVNHRIFQPQKGETLDLEDTLEETVLAFAGKYRVASVYYDPWQFARSAQSLAKQGIKMHEFPQSPPNLTAMSTNLYEAFKGQNLMAYPDDAIRLAMQRAVAKETSRGLKITKEKSAHKIDIVVALAMAALGAIEQPSRPARSWLTGLPVDDPAHEQRKAAMLAPRGPRAVSVGGSTVIWKQ